MYRSPHPARAVLVQRRISVGAIAERMGQSRSHVSGVLLKRYPATASFRAKLSALLGLPEVELFDEQAARMPARAYPGDELLRSAS